MGTIYRIGVRTLRALIAATMVALCLAGGVSNASTASAAAPACAGRGVPTSKISVQLWTFAEYIGFGTDAATIARTEEVFRRLRSMGYVDGNRVFDTRDLAAGNDILFCATGVTDGDLLRGVRFFGEGIRVSSLFMSLKSNVIRFVDTIYREEGSKLAISFT